MLQYEFYVLLPLPNPPSPFVARSISMVHQPEPIGRRWLDRDRGRVGLGIAVALDDDAGPSPRKLHATAPIAICSPRASGATSNSTGRAGFSVGFCGGSRSQGGDLPAGGVVDEACAADFLSNCYLCKKKLHGKDIFMYRLIKLTQKAVLFPTNHFIAHHFVLIQT